MLFFRCWLVNQFLHNGLKSGVPVFLPQLFSFVPSNTWFWLMILLLPFKMGYLRPEVSQRTLCFPLSNTYMAIRMHLTSLLMSEIHYHTSFSPLSSWGIWANTVTFLCRKDKSLKTFSGYGGLGLIQHTTLCLCVSAMSLKVTLTFPQDSFFKLPLHAIVLTLIHTHINT